MNKPDPADAPVAPPTPAPVAPNQEPRKSHRVRWLVLVVILVAAVAGFFYWRSGKASAASAAAKSGAAAAVPVVAVTAKADDMFVYLSGLGNITAYNTVTLQARVSGELISVNYQEGQNVHKGDLLCKIDPRPFQVVLVQSQGALDRDQANLDNAKLQLQRYEDAKEAIPVQTIDTQRALVLQDDGNVKTDQGQVDAANLNLEYCNITAPFDGRVGLRLVDQGTLIAANTTLVVVTQVQPISAIFNLPEDDIPLVQKKLVGDQQLTASAYNRDFSQKLADGTLLALDNEMSASGTLQLKAVFPNRDNLLFPGQFVNVRLLLESVHATVVIPAAAVQIGPQSSFVYVVKADSTIEQRTVVPTPTDVDTVTMVAGHTEGELVSIQSGLAAGEQVVTEGFDKLQQGGKVTVTQPGGAKPKTTTK